MKERLLSKIPRNTDEYLHASYPLSTNWLRIPHQLLAAQGRECEAACECSSYCEPLMKDREQGQGRWYDMVEDTWKWNRENVNGLIAL